MRLLPSVLAVFLAVVSAPAPAFAAALITTSDGLPLTGTQHWN